jgi:excisionase family DNA binding protein
MEGAVTALQTLPDKPVLTVREAAGLLGVNVKTLYAEITAGRFPAIRLGRAI